MQLFSELITISFPIVKESGNQTKFDARTLFESLMLLVRTRAVEMSIDERCTSWFMRKPHKPVGGVKGSRTQKCKRRYNFYALKNWLRLCIETRYISSLLWYKLI